MPKIFVVQGSDDYGPGVNLRAFTSSLRAERFKERCRAYESKEPVFPEADQSDEAFNEAYDVWHAAHKAWLAKHPAKQSFENFTTEPLELYAD